MDALTSVVLLAVRQGAGIGELSSATIARRLTLEHALVRRACAELNARGFIDARPAGGASPALKVRPKSQDAATGEDAISD